MLALIHVYQSYFDNSLVTGLCSGMSSDEECFVDQDDEDPAPSSEDIFGSPWPAVPSISPASSDLHGSHLHPHPQPSQAKPTFFPHRGFLFQADDFVFRNDFSYMPSMFIHKPIYKSDSLYYSEGAVDARRQE